MAPIAGNSPTWTGTPVGVPVPSGPGTRRIGGTTVPRSACDGIQVVEMGAGSIAGSLAGMLLADNGARVVKIEPPEGDRLRTGSPSGFLVWNRGKESLVADLRTAGGRDEARRLMLQADVVIEGFAPGVADGWGLGYEDLRAENTGLVYCSIKGFGSTGPYANLPAYEGVVAAKSGFWTLGAFAIRSGPIFNGAPMASNGTGHMAAAGILGALLVRERTGCGQRLEATMVQGLNPFDYFGTMTWQHVQQKTGGKAHGTSAIASVMSGAIRTNFIAPTGDGRWVNFTHMMPNQAQALSRALGLGDILDDPVFANQPFFASAEDAAEWENRVWEALRTKSYAEWEPILLADPDIAFELARKSEEGLDHVQIRHNHEAVTIDDPDVGPVEQVGPVASFSRTPAQLTQTAPRLGDHGDEFTAWHAPASEPTPAHPLAGITIVELGYFYAMPYGVTMAAALGARVIKLETEDGDPMRRSFGMPEVSGAKCMEGKESLAIDLRTDEGRQIALEVLKTADVFVDGFRPGVTQRLGLDQPTLAKLNPRLLYVHAAGYGASGPYAHRPIYAGVASALAGQVHRHAGYWLDPELTTSLSVTEAQIVILPRLRGPTDGDANASLAVFTTIMLGLFERQRSGLGQLATTTMIGGNALAYADDFNRYQGKPPVPLADPENYGLHALYRVYPAATGWVFLAAARQKEWEAFAAGIDRVDLLDDDRFRTPELRTANDDALIAALESTFAAKSAKDWEAMLVPKGIACVASFDASTSEFTCTDPVLQETGLVVEVDHPELGRILRHGLPVAFSDTPGRVAPGSRIGQHTDQILTELGYADDAIAALREKRIVFGPTA
ncbi:MAG: CoA transferase [Acidobacteria bacterium]|nr:CoA transferase [Acidobacteriota bacterium]